MPGLAAMAGGGAQAGSAGSLVSVPAAGVASGVEGGIGRGVGEAATTGAGATASEGASEGLAVARSASAAAWADATAGRNKLNDALTHRPVSNAASLGAHNNHNRPARLIF